MKRSWIHACMATALVLLAVGCSQPNSTTASAPAAAASASTGGLSSGQVTTTVKGVVLDGLGNPVPGITISYSDGANPAIPTTSLKANASRTIQTSSTTDSTGTFELQYLSQTSATNGSLGGTVYVSLFKAGYTGRRIPVTIPTVSTLGAQTIGILNGAGTAVVNVAINVGQTVQVDLTNSGTTNTSTGTKTYVTNSVGGFHIATDLGVATMFKLAAEVTGSVNLLANDTTVNPNSTSVPAAAGSVVAFNLPDATYSPYVFTAVVDATGKFVFGASGKSADGIVGNALPIFAGNSSGTAGSTGNASISYWGSAFASSPYFSVQAAGGQADAIGSAFYTVTAAQNANSNQMANLSFVTTSPTAPQVLGTLYAVADHKARLVSWTPQTLIDSTVIPMTQFVGATATPTPITLTFDKAMDTTNDTALGISLTDSTTGQNYWSSAGTVTWNAAGTTATLAPAVAFPKGRTVNLNITGWVTAATATAPAYSVSAVGMPSFTVQNGILLTNASWLDATRTTNPVALNATPTLTFSVAPARFDPTATKLVDTSNGNATVNATFAIVGSTLVATPATALRPGDTYEFRFSVNSGLAGDPSVTYDGTTLPQNSGFIQSQLRFQADPSLMMQLASTNLWAFDNGSGTTNPVIPNSTVQNQNPNIQFNPTTAITLKFNKPVATTPAPTFTLVKTAGSVPVLNTVSFDATRNTVTITPAVALTAATQYTVSYTAYADVSATPGIAAGVVYDSNAGLNFTTTAGVPMKLVASNTVIAGQGNSTTFAVGSAITLTFDTALSPTLINGVTPYSFTLTKVSGSVVVPTTVTLDATSKIVTITPVDPLLPLTAYTVDGTAYGVGTTADLTMAQQSFTTAWGAALTAPSLTLDAVRLKAANGGIGTYNEGAATVYVTVTPTGTEIPRLATPTPFTFEYRILNLDGSVPVTGAPWVSATGTLTAQTAASFAYSVPVGAWTGSQSVQVRTRAMAIASYQNSGVSSAVTVKDTTPMVFGSYNATVNAALGPTMAVPGTGNATVTLGLGTNASTTADAITTYSLLVPSGTWSIPTLLSVSLTGASVDVTLNSTKTTATIRIVVPASNSLSTPTTPSGSFVLQLSDAAGNVYDFNANTLTQDNLTITL